MLDHCRNACISTLYVLYVGVVRGALSIFSCSVDSHGVKKLDADPAILCDEVSALCAAGRLARAVKLQWLWTLRDDRGTNSPPQFEPEVERNV
jgi:hypothetical protein